jgi:hypothetical protein
MTYDLQTTDAELIEARNSIIEVSIKRYIFHGKTPDEACAIVRAALDAPWPPRTTFDKPA